MSRFDRRQLRYFVAVAEELHFGNAARRLHISQPPLSQQIAELERDLGVMLFYRTKRKVEITAAGEQFLRDARLILTDMDKAASRARAAAEGQTGFIRIGLNYSAPINPVFSVVLRRFAQMYPQVQLELHENTSAKQIEGLIHRTLDLCFIWPTRDDNAPDMTLIPLTRDELHMVMARDHSLAKKPRFSASDLNGQTIFLTLRQTRMDFFDALMKACRNAGAEPVIRTDVIQLPFIMNIVAASGSVTFIPEFFKRIKPADTVFRACDFLPKPARIFPLSLIYRTADASPLVKNFAATARSVASLT